MSHVDSGSVLEYDLLVNMFTMENLATSLSIVGAIVNIRKSRWGFAIWTVASIIWIVWGLSAEPIHWGFCLSQTVFLGLNIWGFISWSNGAEVYGNRGDHGGLLGGDHHGRGDSDPEEPEAAQGDQ